MIATDDMLALCADRRVLDDALQERGHPPLGDGELLDAMLELASERQQHELACRFAERVLRLVPEGEDRPRLAIEAKRAWLRGEISDEELAAAAEAAREAAEIARAARAAWAAWHTARHAAWSAAEAAREAAEIARAARAAWAAWAAWHTARHTAWYTARTAGEAARDAAWSAAWSAAKAAAGAATRADERRQQEAIAAQMLLEEGRDA